jgi:hypothetical protein
MTFQNFAENQDSIEERWTVEFGDRLTEMVFIGINLDENLVHIELEKCICTEEEIVLMRSGMFKTDDDFPIEKQYSEN